MNKADEHENSNLKIFYGMKNAKLLNFYASFWEKRWHGIAQKFGSSSQLSARFELNKLIKKKQKHAIKKNHKDRAVDSVKNENLV